MRHLAIVSLCLLMTLLSGCPSVAPEPWDRPVIVNKIGREVSNTIVEDCLEKAKAAGLMALLEGSTEENVLRNQNYRNFVGRCVVEQDYVILGWN